MSFEADIDGEMVEYELDLAFDEKNDEYVALYVIGGDSVHVGRGSSVNRAVTDLAERMNGEITAALGGYPDE